MAMDKKQIMDWLKTLPPKAEIAIDEGGTTLIEMHGDAYLEVGGEPLDDDDDDNEDDYDDDDDVCHYTDIPEE